MSLHVDNNNLDKASDLISTDFAFVQVIILRYFAS